MQSGAHVRRQGVFCALPAVLLILVGLSSTAFAGFVTFESGQVRPLALVPNGGQLFAVNTPDNRLEIFDVAGGTLTHVGAVPVGMEPVAVAVRPDGSQAWVVNHLSDSVSVVDLTVTPPRVVRTLLVGDEPRDIVFGGASGNRAFITAAHRGQNTPFHLGIDTVLRSEGSGRADVWVFDADDLGVSLGGAPVQIVTLFCDTPRALAVTPDGGTVYAAAFESGNQTTSLLESSVCNGGAAAPPCNLDGTTVPGGLPGGQVPAGLPAPNQNLDGAPAPEVGLIVKFDPSTSTWTDQLSRNWTNAVRFWLPDLDVFAIDANADPPAETASFAHVGTVLFNMAVNPVSQRLYVSNTDAHNEVRFEGPGGGGSTVRGHLHEARITVIDGSTVTSRHLNKHLDYSDMPQPLTAKEDSLATPVGMAVSSDGSTLYVAAFGSSKVGVFATAQLENDTFTPSAANHIVVSGGGPSGLVLDEANDRLYVFTRFDNSISVVDTLSKSEVAHLPVYNPEPASVVAGRRFLYDAHFTSSTGEASCSSCHVFGDFDSLGWDLGNPDGQVVANPNPFTFGLGGPFHPMKGPMTTQTLRGMATHGPMHWRGDRTGGDVGQPLNEALAFTAFQVAFDGLLGRDEGPLSATDMQAFTNFILQVTLPPNPIRELDNTLTTAQQNGANFFFGPTSDGSSNCDGCHRLSPGQGFFGTDGGSTFETETQEFKVPHLRNLYQKVGMFGLPSVGAFTTGSPAHTGDQVRGFGFLHDGSVDTLFRFHQAAVFFFPGGDAQRRDVESFMFAFDTNLAPIVGQQITLTSGNGATVGGRIDLLLQSAQQLFLTLGMPDAHRCDLIAKGVVDGEERGFLYDPATNRFRSDRAGEAPRTDAALRALIDAVGESLTYTCAPPGSGQRMGIDRDEDGFFDRDELDQGSDPADPSSLPGGAPTPTPTMTPVPVLSCSPVPVFGCRASTRSLIYFRTTSGQQQLIWKWLRGSADLDASDFGAPTSTTSYALCVYHAPGLLGQLDVAAGSSTWRSIRSGFKYSDPAGIHDGVLKMLLKGGAAGSPKIVVKAKGANIPLPNSVPGGVTTPVTVQLINSDGECWSAFYTQPPLMSGNEVFKGKF